MKRVKVNYIVTEEFKTTKPNLSEQELKNIFNKKYFRYIMRQETRLYNDTDIKNNETKQIQ